MLDFLRTMLLRDTPDLEPPAAAPAREWKVCDVPFNPRLVEELTGAHDQLRQRFRSVVTHYLNESESACRDAIDRFDNELRAYLVKDTLEFDPYMRCVLEDDPDALLLLVRINKQMREVARRVHEVAEAHRCGRLDAEDYRRFGLELSRIDDGLAVCLDARHDRLFQRYRLLHGHARA